MSTLVRPQTAYGISQPTFGVAPAPIMSTRAPAVTDYSTLGTLWVNTATNVAWILTSVVANVATWAQITP
jgi:hypothetical protein